MIIFRRIRYDSIEDLEILVMLQKNTWILPDKLPSRYSHRAIQVEDSLWQVKSYPHLGSTATNCKSFHKGFWITRDDTTERGGMRAVFGIPLHPDVCSSFGMLGGFLSFPSPVMVAYHGTSKANYASIQQHGLHATHGQLGKGLYIGSFWKACRFAGRDQTYTLRSDPIVLRILWTGTIQVYPSSVACPCSMCSAKPEEKRLTCDHLKVWNNFDAGQLRIGQYSDGKWITQNEEWCVAPSCILRLGEMVDIDPASISGPHYDPTQRTIRIV